MTTRQSDTLVLICTYNERPNLPSLVEAIRNQTDADILVVDDGSPDGTGQWALDYEREVSGFHAIVREGKLGLGSAIRRGLEYGAERGYKWLLNLDADFSHDPMDIPKLLEARSDLVALVIGSRYVPGGGLKNCSWRRHFVSRSANLYARTLLGWPIRDCSSAYRCYRLEETASLPWSQIQCSGYGFLEEILWFLWKGQKRVIEVPIVYTEREQGISKISVKEARGTLETLHRLARRRFFSRAN